MRKYLSFIMAGGLILTLLISCAVPIVRDGRRLDELRGSVLRLHILANSDSDEDQRLKLCVRDALLESGVLSGAGDLSDACALAEERLPEIETLAEEVLRGQGCSCDVHAEIAEMYFDERTYGDITMPAGEYTALRVSIGEAKGHNWWCVMFPPLCIPAACGEVTDSGDCGEMFSEEELDIMYKPKKYRVRFAIWDELGELFG
ncbi:MAG: stage II sporulation protein R [Ruminococcus sp.]|nr:stage II sporulation protein R [Ruminococcus sp.]